MSAADNRLVVRLCELPIGGDPDRCMKRAVSACVKAPVPDVAVLPELFTIGYRLDRIREAALTPSDLQKLPLARAAGSAGVWIVGGSFPVRTSRGIVNTMPVFDPGGRLVHTVEKIHLFRNMGEDTVFSGGSPAGVFRMGGITAGAAICYDLRFPEVWRPMALGGARVMFVVAQWPKPRRKVFRSLLQARSAEAQVFTVGCNLGGDHLGAQFRGGGGVSSPSCDFIRGVPVSPGVRDFEIHPGQVDTERNRIDCLADRRPEVYGSNRGGMA